MTSKRTEDTVWTIQSVTFDKLTFPVDIACPLPAGVTKSYILTFDNPMARIFLRSGEHDVQIVSTLSDAQGKLLTEVTSDIVRIEID